MDEVSGSATPMEATDVVAIGAAAADDLARLLELYRHLNASDAEPAPERSHAIWETILENPWITVFVAESAGELLASCTLIIVPNLTRRARPYGLIENVVTHADARRRGLGKAVLETALIKAWAADCYKVMLMTGRKDEGTLGFYEAVGFERGSKTAFQIRRT